MVRLNARYVELAARSHFSFLRSAAVPELLMKRAKAQKFEALAVADVDGLYGIVRANQEAELAGVRLIVGCEVTVDAGFGAVTLHVQDHTGYTNLCLILTEAHKDGRMLKGRVRAEGRGPHNARARVSVEFVCAHAEGLWAMVPSLPAPTEEQMQCMMQAFGSRLSVGTYRHLDGHDEARDVSSRRLEKLYGVAICATNAVRYTYAEDKPVFDVLHCIREGQTLEEAGRALSPNAEAHLKSPDEMAAVFADEPAWLARSVHIADACRFSMKQLRYVFPFDTGSDGNALAETPDQRLERLSLQGMEQKYKGQVPEKVRSQVQKELKLIAQMNVAQYFLCVREVVEVARQKDILCQGRGSAANSAVCFCLGITSVDPSSQDLLFERFLSADRKDEPPDIDVDFEHERREEVIQAIYSRYGRSRAAMVSEVICYRGKSALREVSKVFGLNPDEVESMVDAGGAWGQLHEVGDRRLKEEGFNPQDQRIQHVVRMARAISGFPRHLSIHVGGFVLSSEPLTRIAPIEPASMQDRTVIPWDKDDLEALGFFKIDVLALGMLSALRRALEYINDRSPSAAALSNDRLANIPNDDQKVYEAFHQADTIGVFQVESRAQMSMLPRLKPKNFYDLVVQVALVRPGPIQGGMVHRYLKRRQDPSLIDYPHEVLKPVLKRTLGVPLFQEQVMQLAIVGAGYTGDEADQLRRDMASWKRTGNLSRHKEKLAQGFAKQGISAEWSERLYQQIHGFAEYGFPESHAASFARLVYASAWVKTHYPAEFAVALVNSQPMGFYSVSTLLRDAQKKGVEVRGICVMHSEWDCSFELDSRGKRAIRVGLRQVRGLRKDAAERLVEARKQAGPFAHVEDLVLRAGLHDRDLDLLARAGALSALAPQRRDAMWKVRAPREAQGSLFAGMALETEAPTLPPMSRRTQLLLDYASTGLSVSDHPMLEFRARLPEWFSHSESLKKMSHGHQASVAGLVLVRQRPATSSGVVFITLEDEFGFVNLVLYARVFERFRKVMRHPLLIAHGRIQKEGEVIHLLVDELAPLGKAGFPSASRDFH